MLNLQFIHKIQTKMRKIVLSMFVVGALLATSCKGEKKEVKEEMKEVTTEVKEEVEATVDSLKTEAKEATEEVSDAATSALEGVTIPDFSNAALTENLKSYAAYAKEYIGAKGDVGKISAMAAKGSELLAKGKELAAGLGADEMKKYTSVLSAIQSKMAPAK